MGIKKLLKECIEDNPIDFLKYTYENFENNAELLTPGFLKGLEEYKNNCNEKQKILNKKIDELCQNNIELKDDMANALNDYLEAKESENSYYTKNYYNNGIKYGVKIMMVLLDRDNNKTN